MRISDESLLVSENCVKEHVISWGYLQALVAVVFDYARGEIVGQIEPLTLKNFEQALGGIWWSQDAARTIRFNSVEEHVTLYAKRYVDILP